MIQVETATPNVPWAGFHHRWRGLQPPLKPDRDVCASLERLIASHRARVLLLGLTPELTELGHRTVAVDWSASALAFIWPGNSPTRRALRADWMDLPSVARAFSAAVGDGSLNCVEYPAGYRRVCRELARAVQPGGRIVIRMYLTPSQPEPLSAVRSLTLAGKVRSIHGLKWRLAHAISAERGDPNVAVVSILDAFNRLFPDRAALRDATGWTADDVTWIDAYDGLPDIFSFPTAVQALSAVSRELHRPRLIASGTYELADRCPLLVADVAG